MANIRHKELTVSEQVAKVASHSHRESPRNLIGVMPRACATCRNIMQTRYTLECALPNGPVYPSLSDTKWQNVCDDYEPLNEENN